MATDSTSHYTPYFCALAAQGEKTMFGLIFATVVFVLIALLLRWIADRENPTFSVFVPAQMHSLVTTKSNKVTDVTKGGGNVVDVVHSIPGKRLDKSPKDPMDWYYKDGKESRGILYLLGIQIIGFFRYLRLNDVRTFRWGRKDEEREYHMQAKSQQTRYVFFSGQHDVMIEHVETIGILRVNLRFNIIYEETFPIRVRLRTADPYAVLTMMVTRIVISMVGGIEPKELIKNKDLQKALAGEIQAIASDDVEVQLGITIKKVTLADVNFDDATQTLLERKTIVEIEAEANLITAHNEAAQVIARATGDRDAQVIRNTGDADRVTRVIIPAARDERTVAVRVAEAYENNETVTTFAPGASTMMPLGK